MNRKTPERLGQTLRVPSVMRTSFAGSPRAFLGLLVRGSLLQIPTFGFYRFWFITEIRRYLWSNTRLGEVHATSGVDPERTDKFLKRLGLQPCGGNYAVRLR